MKKRSMKLPLAATALLLLGCYAPKDSQRYFAAAAAEDPDLVELHRTPLYTVYWDHVLSRCVLHSAHTWGESGGGGGGTGVGVSVFTCDPARIEARKEQLESLAKRGGTPSLPARRPAAERPEHLATKRDAFAPPAPSDADDEARADGRQGQPTATQPITP